MNLKENIKIWQGATIILLALVVFFVLKGNFSGVSSNEAGEKTISYINTNLLKGQTAKLISVESDRGLYKIKLDIGGQEFDSYVTKDGEFLFVSGVDMTKPLLPTTGATNEPVEYPKKAKPNVKMFVMAFCPFGQQAEKGLIPVAKLLKDKIEFEPHYVIYANYGGGGSDYCIENGKYCSMHGINELNEDIRQLCIWKYNKDKWLDYISNINDKCSLNDIETCWEGIAKNNNIDTKKIKDCQSKEAVNLVKGEFDLNTKYSVQGSPTVLINDINYNGARGANDFKGAICSAFTQEPTECSTVLESGAAAVTGNC